MTAATTQEARPYDRNAVQRVPYALNWGDGKAEVAFLLILPTDEEILEATDAEIENEDGSHFEKLFDKYIVGAEGMGDGETDFTLEELREIVPGEEKRVVIGEYLLGAGLAPRPKLTSKINWRKPPTVTKHPINAFFDGSTVICSHRLCNPGADHYRVADAIERRAFPIKFGDQVIKSVARGWYALYAALIDGAGNYADQTTVPAHHRLVAARAHLQGKRELLLGK